MNRYSRHLDDCKRLQVIMSTSIDYFCWEVSKISELHGMWKIFKVKKMNEERLSLSTWA